MCGAGLPASGTYESGLIPLFAAITGGVGVLVGIDTAMAIGGVIAVTISLVLPSGSTTSAGWIRAPVDPRMLPVNERL